MFRRALLALALALAVTLPGYAQEQTGTIAGTVTDSSGAVLPGVTVEARDVNRASAPIVTTSDSVGQYRFVGLRPGVWEVYAKLQGFNPARVENINLRLGQVLTVDLALAIAGQAETVQVTAESPLIDTKQSARSTDITAEQISRLPKGRDFSSLVTQAPGANNEPRSGGLSIDGASAGENRYIIDGAETTNLRSGVQGKGMVVDFIDTVQVKSSGYQAEYGGATGGVVNVVTKSGTNSFRGDLVTYFSSDALGVGLLDDATTLVGGSTITNYTDGRRSLRLSPSDSTVAEYVEYPKDDYTRVEPGFTIGGPIVRDRVWFFTSYIPTMENRERTVTFRSNGETKTFEREYITHYSSSNVSAQISDALRGRLAYNLSNGKSTNLLPAPDGSGSPTANYGLGRKTPNWSIGGNLDYVLSNSWFFGVRGGYYLSDLQDESVFQGTRFLFNATTNIGMPGVPESLQRATSFSNVPTNSESTFDKQKRLNLQADTTIYVSAGGQHAIKGGVQFDRIGNEVLSGETGNLVRINWGRALSPTLPVGAFGYYQVRSNGVLPDRGFITQGDINNTNVGLFIQDSWTISNRLTLNLGLRTENESVPSFSQDPNIPDVSMKFNFSDKLAPRVGFAWDLAGDGKTKVFGNWGVFYDIFKLELPRGAFGGDKWLEYYYTLDTPDWTTLDPAGCPPACPGQLIRGPIDFRHPSNDPDANSIDPDIKPMKMQEVAFGIERELGPRLAASLRYVHKQVDRAIEDIGTLDADGNEIYVIGNPGFGQATTTLITGTTTRIPYPKAVRDYDAVEAALEKRFSNNWFARVSYTWSRLDGNYPGLSQSDENGRTSPNVGRSFDYPLMSFDQNGNPVYGRLPTDRPHQFKVQGVYDFTFGTTVGVNQFVESGVPITREAAYITGSGYPIQYLGRLSDGRTPVLSQTDLYLSHGLKFGGDREFRVMLDVLNLWNQDEAINTWRTELGAGQQIDVTEEQFYAGVDTQALIAAQQLERDPRFLQSSEFQMPRTVRIGVKFSF